MNYNIHIENLGAIKQSNINITPLTILAGENGTGKSFVTKFLYSVLSVINVDTYSNYTLDIVNKLSSTFNQIIDFLLEPAEENEIIRSTDFEEDIIFLKKFQDNIQTLANSIKLIETDYYAFDKDFIVEFQKEVTTYQNKVLPRLIKLMDKMDSSEKDIDSNFNLFKNVFKTFRGFRNPRMLLKNSYVTLKDLIDILEKPEASYLKVISEHITDELKENFQISDIRHLINTSEDYCLFLIKDLVKITIDKENGLTIEIELKENLSRFKRTKHILFFESPVYWRLLPIIDDLDNSRNFSTNQPEILSGIPRYFYDLKRLLFTNFKEGERPPFIVNCAADLKKHLRGHFKPSDSDLTFENSDGETIPKNLVSFGMTNIGIIQAVLSKNIINKGSFVFIDEPESNLHPEWQAILANVLVELAKNGVYVIITTHSSDMLKAFDISTREQKVDEEISTYYFKSDGKLLNMTDDKFSPIEMARRKLLETYEELMMRGYFL